jgi:transcriptional regulator with XRE-family HTH domain
VASSSTLPLSEGLAGPAVTRILLQLVRLRRRKKLKQSAVARKMGVSRQQIYNVETGRQGHPSILTVERYAKAIGARLIVVER